MKLKKILLDLNSSAIPDSDVGTIDPLARDGLVTIGDYGAQTTYLTNSPAGEYGLLRTASTDIGTDSNPVIGHIYYQAGVAVITSSMISSFAPTTTTAGAVATIGTGSVKHLLKSGTINEFSNHIRYAYDSVDFNKYRIKFYNILQSKQY